MGNSTKDEYGGDYLLRQVFFELSPFKFFYFYSFFCYLFYVFFMGLLSFIILQ